MKCEGPVLIRPLGPGDTEAIVAITGEVFGPFSIDAMIENTVGQGGADWLAVKARTIREDLAENPEGCFVAECDGKVVGYVTTTIDRLAGRGRIPDLAVSAAFQRRGLGRRLVTRAIEHFRSLHLAQAKIETLACNTTAEQLYRAMGFAEVVRQIHFIMPLK